MTNAQRPAIARVTHVVLDDGYFDNDDDAQQAAARILEIVQTQLPSEALLQVTSLCP